MTFVVSSVAITRLLNGTGLSLTDAEFLVKRYRSGSQAVDGRDSHPVRKVATNVHSINIRGQVISCGPLASVGVSQHLHCKN